MVSIVLFTRDLRLTDNPALALAAAEGPLLPLCVIDPQNWLKSNVSSRQYDFFREAVAGLAQSFEPGGQGLVLRAGALLEVLETLRKRVRVRRLYTRYGCSVWPDSNLDGNVANWADRHGIDWIRTGDPELRSKPIPAPGPLPQLLESSAQAPLTLPLPAAPCPARPRGDRESALARLEQFLTSRALPLPEDPFHALERRASRLGPWLAYGVVSGRELVAASVAARPEAAPGARQELRRFETALARRANAFAAAPNPAPSASLPAALAQGQTGLPFLDACLRHLNATGWLPETLRQMLLGAAGLIPSALVPRAPEAMAMLLSRLACDHDPALHAAALAHPVPPSDPVRLGERLDPEGRLIRRWLPELHAIPDAHLHRPWLWPEARRRLGQRYPEPLFDPGTQLPRARASARAAAQDAAQDAGQGKRHLRSPRKPPPKMQGQYAFALEMPAPVLR